MKVTSDKLRVTSEERARSTSVSVVTHVPSTAVKHSPLEPRCFAPLAPSAAVAREVDEHLQALGPTFVACHVRTDAAIATEA